MRARGIVGKRIVAVVQTRTFAREYRGKLRDPYVHLEEIVLEDGSAIRFTVQETEFGDYGIIGTHATHTRRQTP